jgi:hypothetical protein
MLIPPSSLVGMVPVLPVVFFVLRDRIPRNRYVLWPLAMLSSLGAAALTVGFQNLFGFSIH